MAGNMARPLTVAIMAFLAFVALLSLLLTSDVSQLGAVLGWFSNDTAAPVLKEEDGCEYLIGVGRADITG